MAVLPGDYGKVRPVLIVQSEKLDVFGSIIVCPLTSALETAGPVRVAIAPDEANKLDRPSLVMIDKIGAMEKSRVRAQLGPISARQLTEVDERLALLLGLDR